MSIELLEKNSSNHSLFSFDVTDWFIRNQKRCLVVAAALLVTGGGVTWWMTKNKAQEVKDIETATVLAEGLEANGDALSELIALEKRYTSLQGRYDGLIAEELILQKKNDQVNSYANRAISQLEALNLSEHARFADISRLASTNNYEEALKVANELEQAIASGAFVTVQQQKKAHQYALHACTLFKIAALNKALGRTDDMHQALATLSTLLGLHTSFSLDQQEELKAAAVLSLLQDENSSLLDYLKRNHA